MWYVILLASVLSVGALFYNVIVLGNFEAVAEDTSETYVE
jgi:hypothetical protein